MTSEAVSRGGRAARPEAAPRTRTNFKQLLATNPNYFGNLVESPFSPVEKMVGNTTYEEVSCLGFNPALNLLEATVQIKLPGGFLGSLCGPGSTEFVRFYIDYGGGWVDVGLSSFNAHDIPNMVDCAKNPDKPLTYVVTELLKPQRRLCVFPNLPKVRAILSWNMMPPAGQPNWPPVWGNVIDRYIQIKPRQLFVSDFVELLPKEALEKLPPLTEEIKPIPIPIPDPPPFTLAELAEMYAKPTPGAKKQFASEVVDVQPHRFGYAHIQAAMQQSSQDELVSNIADWKKLNLDWVAAVQALDKTKADVTYEELTCLGLDYNLERLVATFQVKKSSGYSGSQCGPGSQEYIAFWADWDNTCEWTYLNTVQVNVHDYQPLPAGGLSYSAILPVDLSGHRRPCAGPDGGPKIARVRAVLSWNSAPSNTDPDALNHWGNRLDAHVQLQPGDPTTGFGPVISIIGGIGLPDIDVFGNGMTKSNATFAFGGSPADPVDVTRFCPFGGLVIVQGPPVAGHKFRLHVREFGNPATDEVVKNSYHVVNWLGFGSDVIPDPMTGFSSYMSTLANMDQVLAHWYPSGDKLWEIQLESVPLGGGASSFTPWYSILSDNTGPRRRPAVAPFEPPDVTCEIHIDSGGDCKDFSTGATITGRFTARDIHFGNFSLSTLPSSMSPNAPTTLTPSTSQTATFAANGDAWQLNTTGMKACGYVVLLQVWDRSILNSVPGQHNYNYFDVGFCLRD